MSSKDNTKILQKEVTVLFTSKYLHKYNYSEQQVSLTVHFTHPLVFCYHLHHYLQVAPAEILHIFHIFWWLVLKSSCHYADRYFPNTKSKILLMIRDHYKACRCIPPGFIKWHLELRKSCFVIIIIFYEVKNLQNSISTHVYLLLTHMNR